MELREEDFVRGLYLSARREDLPKNLGVGREYELIIFGHLHIPTGKKTVLNIESNLEGGAVPEAVIQFTDYQFGTLDDSKATKIKFRLESFLN